MGTFSALAPHWLDGAFTSGHASPAGVAGNLARMPKFEEAVAAALAAYRDREAEFKKTPNLMSGSPAQAARLAFLEALGQDSHG